MADYKKLTPFILEWEGGYANDPDDRGGATNRGVTIGTFRHYYGQQATVADLRAMTQQQWESIFLKGYWIPWRGDRIENQSVADICVDWAWASGTGTSIKQVQRLLAVSADGIVGQKTLAAIGRADQRLLHARIKAARLAFVEGIARRSPSQKKFLRGWKRRINALCYKP